MDWHSLARTPGKRTCVTPPTRSQGAGYYLMPSTCSLLLTRFIGTKLAIMYTSAVVIIIIIDHITSGCRTLAGTEYTARHNSAAKVIHQALATTNQHIENNDPYCNYTPTSVLESNQYKLTWDVEIHSDKTIPANRPDIVFQSKTLSRKMFE
nr:unnamed protein product [Callosobruchus analis]